MTDFKEFNEEVVVPLIHSVSSSQKKNQNQINVQVNF